MKFNNPMNLIHVTKLENLSSILDNGLKYSVSREVLQHVKKTQNDEIFRKGDFYIPMISFFGMEIKEHLNLAQSYGNLGIILNYKYTNKMLNPVRYINEYSILSSRIANFEDNLKGMNPGVLEASFRGTGTGFRTEAIRMYVENIIYSKSFTSELSRRNIITNEYEIVNNNFHFGLEREWRLIPLQLYDDLRRIKKLDSKDTEVVDYGYCNIKNSITGFIVSSQEHKDFVINLLQDKKNEISNERIIISEGYGK